MFHRTADPRCFSGWSWVTVSIMSLSNKRRHMKSVTDPEERSQLSQLPVPCFKSEPQQTEDVESRAWVPGGFGKTTVSLALRIFIAAMMHTQMHRCLHSSQPAPLLVSK